MDTLPAVRKIMAAAFITICVLSSALASATSAQGAVEITNLRSTRAEPRLVVLTWDLVPGAREYVVYDADSAERIDVGTDNWAVASNLSPRSTYRFFVEALVSVDVGDPIAISQAISVTTPAPTLIEHTPFLVHEGLQKLHELEVKWATRFGVGTTFELFRDGVKIADATEDDAANGYVDSGLLSGTSYTYKIREVGADGELGPFGPEVVGTTAGLPPGAVPPAPEVTNTFVDNSRVVLRIKNKEDTLGRPLFAEYVILRDNEPIKFVRATNHLQYTWFVDEVQPGTTYSYYVVALSFELVSGDASETLEITTTGAPAPTDLGLRTTRVEPRVVVLNWETTRGASYIVKRDGQEIGSSANGWFVDTTAPSTNYTYDVSETADPSVSSTVLVTTPDLP